MRLATVSQALSADPILQAMAAYRGSVIDLDEGRVYGPATLARIQANLCSVLPEAGLLPGHRVVMALGNGPGFICLLTAILARGGAPLLVHMKTPPAELRRTAMRFGAEWVAADSWSIDEFGAAGMASQPLASETLPACLWHGVDRGDRSFDADYPLLPGMPLHPTSGTTGVPKIAVRPGAAAVAEARHYIDTIGIEASDAILAATPMSHAYAYGMAVMVPLVAGCNIVTTRSFEAAVIRRALAERRISILPAVPAMLDLLTFGAGDQLRQTVRCVLSAGAPLPDRTARRFFECTGMHVRPLYGTTETGGISVGLGDGRLATGGYVGPPMQGVEAEIRAALDESRLQDDWGRVHIRSSSMMAGYLGRTGIDDSPLEDGWFFTGDLGMGNSDTGLFLKGRQSEVINVGGLKVVPCEVEEVIATLHGVTDVKVYAAHDRKGRQSVKAAVVAGPGFDPKSIQEHCARHLVYYKQPRTVVMMDRLPRTASGKIIAAELP